MTTEATDNKIIRIFNKDNKLCLKICSPVKLHFPDLLT